MKQNLIREQNQHLPEMKPCPAQASSPGPIVRAAALADIPVLPGLQTLPEKREWGTCWQSPPSVWKEENLCLSEHETNNARFHQCVPGLMLVSQPAGTAALWTGNISVIPEEMLTKDETINLCSCTVLETLQLFLEEFSAPLAGRQKPQLKQERKCRKRNEYSSQLCSGQRETKGKTGYLIECSHP